MQYSLVRQEWISDTDVISTENTNILLRKDQIQMKWLFKPGIIMYDEADVLLCAYLVVKEEMHG